MTTPDLTGPAIHIRDLYYRETGHALPYTSIQWREIASRWHHVLDFVGSYLGLLRPAAGELRTILALGFRDVDHQFGRMLTRAAGVAGELVSDLGRWARRRGVRVLAAVFALGLLASHVAAITLT